MMWNTHEAFGAVSKSLHWGGAILIFALIGMGLWAVNYPLDTPEQMAVKWQLFAFHKTIGVCAFGFGALRLIFMAVQVKPRPLAGHRPLEVFASRTAHWLLTLLMMLVPLAGWVRHASLPGFAPLYLPFGDRLPFVPADPQLSEMASMCHFGFVILLVATILLHAAGTFKHHFLDRDATLTRMLPGVLPVQDTQPSSGTVAPLLISVGLIVAVALGAIAATPQV